MLILDRTNDLSEPDVLYPFALDELLCKRTGEGGPAICHLWRHPRAFVMGMRDSRLPGAASAARWLEAAGYAVAVRNSGGAAVPLDLGVVNLSLILPHAKPNASHFRDDFEHMYGLIAQALAGSGRTVDKGEVKGAFCPGDYDLSINAFKFCGIAQRRQLRAFAVQAFVIAGGSGKDRASLVREFYTRAAEGADPASYPQVTEDSTASLNELAGIGPDAPAVFAEAVKRTIRQRQTEQGMAAAAASLQLPAPDEVREMAKSMRERYSISG
ncbi:lipoate--protein ligase family protein [Paenibacillus beijingensis]|nr:ligase [Paenibacillus beijingensis]